LEVKKLKRKFYETEAQINNWSLRELKNQVEKAEREFMDNRK